MAYCLTGSGQTNPSGSPTDSSNFCQNIWGSSSSDATSYSISDVYAGQIIDNAKFNDIGVKVNQERSRRGHGSRSYSFSGVIDDTHINSLRDGINDAGYTSGFSGVSAGTRVYASNINQMIDKLQAAGNVCVCNCNYCTCNCNYCTCNCNYSCTCNCNYSDERLKREIEFIGKRNGLNIYTFKYLWDDVKRTGVMAQEILKTKYRDAVMQDKNGYYMVDYGMLPYERN